MNNIQKTSVEKLDHLIRKVGFHNMKAKYIKQTADILIKDYGGDIPNTIDDIQKLPGVGPKMSFILESIAFGRCTGIGKLCLIFNRMNNN